MNHRLSQRLVAEAVGTTMLLAAVVFGGVMGERLAAGNVAIALLAHKFLFWPKSLVFGSCVTR